MTFGERLKSARAKMNLSQKELAEKAGIGERSMTKYEQHGVHPQAPTLKKLAEILNVTVSYLLGDDESSNRINTDQKNFLQNAKKDFGYKGLQEAEDVLERVSALFAGGELDAQQKEIFFQSIMEDYLECKAEAREKFTGKKRLSARKLN